MAATAPKIETETPAQETTAPAQELAERWIETSKQAAGEYLTLTEKATETVVDWQRQVAARTDVEWLSTAIEAQAKLTSDVSKLFVSTGRDLLK